MGFFGIWGRLIIVVSVIGFVIGIYESIVLANGVIAVISLLGLLGGIYVGYLGPKVEGLGSSLLDLESSLAGKSKTKDVEADVSATMITSLVEILGEKGLITQEEWEKKVETNLKA